MAKLFLLRHGEARAQHPDHSRPLTAKGQLEVAAKAQHLPSSLLVWVSPLLRAQQSLEQLQQQGFVPQALVQTSALEPDEPLDALLKLLWPVQQDLLLVGHNPLLSSLAHSLSGLSLAMQTGQLLILEGDCLAPHCMQLLESH